MERRDNAGRVRRVYADGGLTGSGVYSDAVIVEFGMVYRITFSGIAAVDPVTGIVAGYESHTGEFAPDALERQVADVFRQLERLMEAVSREIGRPLGLGDLTEALVFLREDYPRVFERFNECYAREFGSRGVGRYPARTTVMRASPPAPAALVEIRFEAMVER